MNLLHITPRRAALGLGVLAASCAIAACGSSGSTSTKSASASSTTSTTSRTGFNRTAFEACLKSHGVTLPSRPPGTGTTPGAGGGFFGGGGGSGHGFASNPKFRAALQACGGGNFRGGGSRGGAGRSRLSHTAIDKFVTCVRQHGYNLPAPNFSGSGSVFPSNIRTNRKFEAASRACASLLRPSGAPPGGASTTASS